MIFRLSEWIFLLNQNTIWLVDSDLIMNHGWWQ